MPAVCRASTQPFCTGAPAPSELLLKEAEGRHAPRGLSPGDCRDIRERRRRWRPGPALRVLVRQGGGHGTVAPRQPQVSPAALLVKICSHWGWFTWPRSGVVSFRLIQSAALDGISNACSRQPPAGLLGQHRLPSATCSGAFPEGTAHTHGQQCGEAALPQVKLSARPTGEVTGRSKTAKHGGSGAMPSCLPRQLHRGQIVHTLPSSRVQKGKQLRSIVCAQEHQRPPGEGPAAGLASASM